jgi:signal transduction histidine kinase
MTNELWRGRLSRALDSLRWIFVVAPLATLLPYLTTGTWGLTALVLVASIPLLWLPRRPGWLLPTALITLVTAAGALWVLLPHSLNSVIIYTSSFYAARFLSRRQTAIVISITLLTYAALFLRSDAGVIGTVLNLALLAAVVLLGVHRRDRQDRIEQTELALAMAQTAAEEHAVAAALAERARIARELHDVLAHSLSGLALTLQGTRLMLLRDGAGEEAIAQVERAQRLASDGLAEARRAVAALREDSIPFDRAVADLLTGYRLDTRAPAHLAIHGEPREIDTATGSAVLRTVQEALANSRKHAPGSAVNVTITYSPTLLDVTVLDHQGRAGRDGPAGYGLRGMRERAELLGGRLSTGPGEDGWRVQLTVPA